MPKQRLPVTVRRLMAVAAVTALVLAACGDDEDAEAERPTTTTTAPSSTSTSAPSREADVVRAWEAFWDGYLEAADPMNPEHPVLAEVATGEELQQLRGAFLARRDAGEVIRGDLDLAPEVVEVNDAEATVRDCYLDRTGIYDSATGERRDTESGVRHLVTVRLVAEGGTWKVASITREGDGCTPDADS